MQIHILLHQQSNLRVILKVGQDNVWAGADACLSQVKLVAYYSLFILEQLPLTCASSVKVILSLINSGMNQVAGTARRMSSKGVVTTKEQL